MRLVIANDHSDVRLWCFKTNNNYPFQARIFADLCACYLSACTGAGWTDADRVHTTEGTGAAGGRDIVLVFEAVRERVCL